MKLVKSLIYYKEGSTTKNCSCLIFRNYDGNNFASYETIKSLMQIAKGFYKFNLMNTESNKPLLVSSTDDPVNESDYIILCKSGDFKSWFDEAGTGYVELDECLSINIPEDWDAAKKIDFHGSLEISPIQYEV